MANQIQDILDLAGYTQMPQIGGVGKGRASVKRKMERAAQTTAKTKRKMVGSLQRALEGASKKSRNVRTGVGTGASLLGALLLTAATGGAGAPILATMLAGAGAGALGGLAGGKEYQKQIKKAKEDAGATFLQNLAPTEENIKEQLWRQIGTDALMGGITSIVPVKDILSGVGGATIGKIPGAAKALETIASKPIAGGKGIKDLSSNLLKAFGTEIVGTGTTPLSQTLVKYGTPFAPASSFLTGSSLTQPYKWNMPQSKVRGAMGNRRVY